MATKKWNADPAHSELQFKVKHLMISKVTGNFTNFSVTAVSENDDFSNADIQAAIQLDSVSTGQPDRDKHLKNADFFDAENHPEIKFKSTAFKKKSDDAFDLTGDLTIKGVTKPVTIQAELGGIAKDPWGNNRAAFSLTGSLSRKEWGLTYNAPLEAGGVMISDEVKILGEIQMTESAE